MLNRGLDTSELGPAGALGLWTRKVYREGFQNGSITAVIRPGDRSHRTVRGWLPQGVGVAIRFIDALGYRPGADEKNVFAMTTLPRYDVSLGEIVPTFLPDDGTTVAITGFLVKTIGELTEDDLRGCSPDCSTPELVKYHLGVFYNLELPGADQVVTIWRFEYRPRVTE